MSKTRPRNPRALVRQAITRSRAARFLSVLLLMGAPIVILSYQSCEGFKPTFLSSSSLEVGRLDPQCLTSQTADACIFLHNPVATLKRPLASANEYDQAQQYAVKIPDARLYNNWVIIQPSAASEAHPGNNGRWIYRMSNAPEAAEQVHNYYWATLFLDQMYNSALGSNLSAASPIVVDTHSDIPGDLEVNLPQAKIRVGQALPAALDHRPERMASHGGLIIEAVGQVLTAKLNPAWAAFSSATHATCGSLNNCSCKTSDGCSAALVLGSATLYRHLFFAQFNVVGVGDSLTNQSGGNLYCGLSTNPANLPNLTKNEAFAACSDLYDEPSPNAYSLGLLFAAIWSPLFDRTQFPNSDPNQLLKLLSLTIAQATESETFMTFFRRALELDNTQFSGRYSSSLRQILSQHGVQL